MLLTDKNIHVNRILWVAFGIVVLLRLYLTGDRDIVALNAPHDEYWYILNAMNRIWSGSYTHMTLIHIPVYSAWLDFLCLFGIPARLAIDVCWLLASAYLAHSLYRLTRQAWLLVLTFLFLAFHPYTFILFDRSLAETFLTVVSAAVLGASIELWTCRNEPPTTRSRLALLVYVLGFALAFHTRKEGVVLAVPLGLLALGSLFDRQRWWRGVGKPALAVTFLVAPLFATIAVGTLIAGGNFLKWGVFARYELAAPGYQRAISALNRIDAGATPRQITVTKDMLALAFRVSPTFRELKPAMDGVIGQQWTEISRPYVATPGEIGNGWFYWALRDVANQSGWHTDARLAETKYALAADELEQAFDTGRLKKRMMLSSFLDPDLGKWLPEVPTSVYNVAKLLVRPLLNNLESPIENASLIQLDHYAEVTGRRRAAPHIAINGWIVAPEGSLIGLGTQNVTSSWQRLGQQPRPDVPGAFGFAVSSQDTPPPTQLHLLMQDGRAASIALSALRVGMTAPLSGNASVLVGIDGVESNARPQRADRWLARLDGIYVWGGYLLCLSTLCALGVAIIRRHWNAMLAMLMLMLAAIAARVVLFGILDASSWNGTQARYVMPAIPFLVCTGVLSIGMLFFSQSKSAKDDLNR